MTDEELRDAVKRLILMQAEQATFSGEVTAALTAIVARLDRIERRLDQFSRAIQPRAVSTQFSRPPAETAPEVADADLPE